MSKIRIRVMGVMEARKRERKREEKREERGRERKREYDIEITARDCGEPREIEYANEEEWPPNSRQVLYYFFTVGSCFEVSERGKKERLVANEFLSPVKRREISSRNPSVVGMPRDE